MLVVRRIVRAIQFEGHLVDDRLEKATATKFDQFIISWRIDAKFKIIANLSQVPDLIADSIV